MGVQNSHLLPRGIKNVKNEIDNMKSYAFSDLKEKDSAKLERRMTIKLNLSMQSLPQAATPAVNPYTDLTLL